MLSSGLYVASKKQANENQKKPKETKINEKEAYANQDESGVRDTQGRDRGGLEATHYKYEAKTTEYRLLSREHSKDGYCRGNDVHVAVTRTREEEEGMSTRTG